MMATKSGKRKTPSPSTGASATMPAVSSPSPAAQAMYLHKLQESSEAVKAGNYRRAIQLYTETLDLDPNNHILYTNRSAAYLKDGQPGRSLDDAIKARNICPKWGKAYLREGLALQDLGRHGDSLAAFATGLGQEPANTQLLDGLLEAALNSPLRANLEPVLEQLEKFGLKSSPFVIIAVVGQELVAAQHFTAATTILEAALRVGTCSLKLRGSVFSALSSALWGLGDLDRAIYHMQQDLAVAKSLGDQEGECRAYGNLGSAYFTKGHYKESLANHRFQLVLAMKLKNRSVAASALGCLGHVYTAIGDYPNALASHKQCVLLLKQSREVLAEAREIGNVGSVYLAMGNFDNAVECHQEHLKIARKMKSNVEEARAYSNLGSAYHYKRNYQKATLFHKEVLKIAEANKDKTLEARAYAGLGHSSRCAGDTMSAKGYHEKQLDNALQTKDKVAEGRACSNLGIIFHQLGEYEAALKLHKVHLKIAKALCDRASQGRAYGNIGNAYSALNKHELAVKQHKQELAISSEVNDRHSEGSTHGNLAVAYQALGKTEMALHHYLSHLSISRELKDLPSEARALCNLGNFHCARGNHSSAVSFYEQFMSLSKELNDSEGESKACFNLGYVHFNLGNFNDAVKYYESDLAFARERKDRLALARAYCNMGLAQKALQKFEEALECQKKCLKLMDALENTPGKLRALGNIGDLMLKVGDIHEAIKIYQQQVNLAKHCESPDLLATAYGALGSAHRLLGQYDKSLAFHTQELNIRQETNDLRGECRAHGNVGNVHMSLGNFLTAYKCYEEMLERSKELGDHVLEGQACGNLGITKMNMNQYEGAIGLLEEQLAMLEQHYGPTTLHDKGRAFGNLGDCYEALGDYEEAVKWHEQHLIIAQQTNALTDQDRAYRGLGNAHKAIGNLQQALVCFEKRLYVAHQTDSVPAKASAYGELGCLHSLLGNLEQAIACLEHQLSLSREMGDFACEGDAACGLGGVYQQMGEYQMALTYHQMDLKIAEQTNNTACQCRAYGNLGLSHESLGNLEEAIHHQEQHLSIAAQMSDGVAKTLAYSSLGRMHHALGHHTQAVQYLQQGLQIAEQLRRKEDEAKIRHRLGLALWAAGDLDPCQQQLHRAADLFETIRRESQCSSEYRLSLFDLQTACYQTLQRVLVSLDRHEEALVIAERACTRAFIDLLLERQAGSAGLFNGTTMDLTPVSIEQITSAVSNQKSIVLCFSVASGHLYSWLLTPKRGIVKFHSIRLADFEADLESGDTQSVVSGGGVSMSGLSMSGISMGGVSMSGVSLLDQCVGQVRESMGIESHITTTATGHRSSTLLSGRDYSDTDSETDDVFQLQLEGMADKLNAESDRTGFLAMLNRSHNLNVSNYSLGSVLSVAGGTVGNRGGGGSVRHSNSSGNLSAQGGDDDDCDDGNNDATTTSGNGNPISASKHNSNSTGNINSTTNNVSKTNSLGGSMRSLGIGSISSGSVRSLVQKRFNNKAGGGKNGAANRSPLSKLYQLLIEPMEPVIAELKETESLLSENSSSSKDDPIDLVLVLQGDLYLIPFLMLRREQVESFLFEKYTTIIVPSISALHTSRSLDARGRPIIQSSGALVVSNPKLTPTICQHWHLQEIPGAEFEARILGELLTCRPLIGAEATKGAVLHQIEQVEVIHFATHISWKLSSIVLSPGEIISSPSQHFPVIDSDDSDSDITTMGGGPSLSEYLLTAADILNLKLRAKLVVLNSGYTDDRAGRINTDGVVGLTRALLSAGAQCVLFSLWPVPDQASKLMMKTLYTALLDGIPVTKALSQAVRTVQATAQFSHPSNWGGWVLVGCDVTLSSKVALMGHALGQIVEAHSTCRQTLKVLLHLVEKSLQRIQQGCKNSMFTTQQSIENKVGQVAGWKDLLQAVGFRFEPSTGGLPPAVFFPQSDPKERLTQASASLQAFLGLPASSVTAMSKFVTSFEEGEDLIHVLREILSKLSARESSIDVLVDVRLWRVPGCHEFLASLGLDLVDVRADNVTLRLSKQAIKRHLQFALQALVSVFDTQEAPRSLQLDSSSSLESLSSNQSGPSSSTLSKSSVTPPLSPYPRGSGTGNKRSLFNPAEMERVRHGHHHRHRNFLMTQGRHTDSSLSHSSTSDQSTPPASPRSPQSPLDPALQLSHQAHIRSMYPSHDTPPPTSSSSIRSGSVSSSYSTNSLVVATDRLASPGLSSPDVPENKMSRGGSVSSNNSNSTSTSTHVANRSSTSDVNSDAESTTHIDGAGYINPNGVYKKAEEYYDSEDSSTLKKNRENNLQGSRSSLRSSRSYRHSQSVESQKSVTFAEQLISQEISFDPSTPRLEDDSHSEGRNSEIFSDDSSSLGKEDDVIDSVDHNASKDFDSVDVDEGSSEQNSFKTASQLRRHFEELNQNKSDNNVAGRKTNRLSGPQTEIKSPGSSTTANSSISHNNTVLDEGPAMGEGAENLAMKVLADVAHERAAVERMQMQSVVQMHMETSARKTEAAAAAAKAATAGTGGGDGNSVSIPERPIPAQRKSSLGRNGSVSPRRSKLQSGSDLVVNPDKSSPLPDVGGVSSNYNTGLTQSSGSPSPAGMRAPPSPLSTHTPSPSITKPSPPIPPATFPKPFSSTTKSRNNFTTPNNNNNNNFHNSNSNSNSDSPITTKSNAHLRFPQHQHQQQQYKQNGNTASIYQRPSASPILPISRQQPHQQQSINDNSSNRVKSAYSSLFPQGGPAPQSPQPQQISSTSSHYHPPPPSSSSLSSSSSSRLIPPRSPSIPSRYPPSSHHHHLPVPPSSNNPTNTTIIGGSGENSISSDNSEGAESNLQSSISSGYHSENSSNFLRSRMTYKSVPPPSTQESCIQDKGRYTQDFVNRTPSFTYSSGSSSPFSRASNDELGGLDSGNNAPEKLSSLSTVFFPPRTTTTNQQGSNGRFGGGSGFTTLPPPSSSSSSNNSSSSQMISSSITAKAPSDSLSTLNDIDSRLSAAMLSSPTPMSSSSSSADRHGGYNQYGPQNYHINRHNNNIDPNSKHQYSHADNNTTSNNNVNTNASPAYNRNPVPASSSMLPATPLVRTNAIQQQSRPDSSNSMSSQYSTSSSTLSAIHRPPLTTNNTQDTSTPGSDETFNGNTHPKSSIFPSAIQPPIINSYGKKSPFLTSRLPQQPKKDNNSNYPPEYRSSPSAPSSSSSSSFYQAAPNARGSNDNRNNTHYSSTSSSSSRQSPHGSQHYRPSEHSPSPNPPQYSEHMNRIVENTRGDDHSDNTNNTPPQSTHPVYNRRSGREGKGDFSSSSPYNPTQSSQPPSSLSSPSSYPSTTLNNDKFYNHQPHPSSHQQHPPSSSSSSQPYHRNASPNKQNPPSPRRHSQYTNNNNSGSSSSNEHHFSNGQPGGYNTSSSRYQDNTSPDSGIQHGKYIPMKTFSNAYEAGDTTAYNNKPSDSDNNGIAKPRGSDPNPSGYNSGGGSRLRQQHRSAPGDGRQNGVTPQIGLHSSKC